MASFSQFVSMCRNLESTKSRLEREGIVASFLATLEEEEVAPAVYFTVGRVFGERDPRVLSVSYMTLSRIAQEKKQSSLVSRPLSIAGVWKYLCGMAERSGAGSARKKEAMLTSLFGEATEEEERYLRKILLGEMRHGTSEGVVRAALARASGVPLEKIRRAHMLKGDLGEVARLALFHPERLECGITLFVPLQPMLAESEDDVSAILEEHGGTTALEYKFDGARIQIHKRGDAVKIFSRRLSEVTESLPEVREAALRLNAEECIAEGEVVAFGERPMPFQELMRRFRRVRDVVEATVETPIRLFLFDVLYLDGETLIDQPNERRREILSAICPQEYITPRIVASSPEECMSFFERALSEGHEGLMAKDPHSPYQPGNRGKRWFKLKKAETLDCVILAADWGTGRRHGWLSNYHLGVHDKEHDAYPVVGKTFKGLTDDEFESTTHRLLSLKTSESEYTVYVRPEIIVEVAFNEIQRSPRYPSGFALRFARILAFREDRDEPDTLDRLAQMFERQFEKKDRG